MYYNPFCVHCVHQAEDFSLCISFISFTVPMFSILIIKKPAVSLKNIATLSLFIHNMVKK